MSLANKYRPQRFSEVLGQAETLSILSTMLEQRRYPPGILFSGGWGSGKTTMARIFANSVLCQDREGAEPCGSCSLCVEFRESPDKVFNFREIDAASEGGVQDVRDIVDESHFRAIGKSDRKVLLIDECHMLTPAAQNAFLKLLEEGSENMLFLFCTTDPDKILRTLFSRTLPFKVREIPKELIVQRLDEVCEKEKIVREPEALSLIVTVKKGHVRDCFMLLDQLSYGPGVTVEAIRKTLSLDLEAEFYRLLYMVSSDIEELLRMIEGLLQRVSIQELHDGISKAALNVFKFTQGLDIGLPKADLSWCEKLGSKLGERALKIAQFLSSKPSPRTQSALECNLLSLRHFLETGFPDEPRQDIQNKSEPQFESPIAALQYHGMKKVQNKEAVEDEEVELWEALDLLNAYVIEDDT